MSPVQAMTVDLCGLSQRCCREQLDNNIDRLESRVTASARKSDSAEVAVFEVRDRLDKVEAVVDDHKALVKDTRATLKKVVISSYTIAGIMITGLASGYVMIFKFITSESGHQILKAVLQVSAK